MDFNFPGGAVHVKKYILRLFNQMKYTAMSERYLILKYFSLRFHSSKLDISLLLALLLLFLLFMLMPDTLP